MGSTDVLTSHTKQRNDRQVVVVDSQAAPTVFVESAVGWISSHGNVHITFASPKADHSPEGRPVTKLVSLRLVMPMSEAQAFAVSLYDYLKSMGVDVPGATNAPTQ